MNYDERLIKIAADIRSSRQDKISEEEVKVASDESVAEEPNIVERMATYILQEMEKVAAEEEDARLSDKALQTLNLEEIEKEEESDKEDEEDDEAEDDEDEEEEKRAGLLTYKNKPETIQIKKPNLAVDLINPLKPGSPGTKIINSISNSHQNAKLNRTDKKLQKEADKLNDIKLAQDYLTQAFFIEKEAHEAYAEAQLMKVAAAKVLEAYGSIESGDVEKIASMTYNDL